LRRHHNSTLSYRHFLQLIVREQKLLEHASKHRLTTLPVSQRRSNREIYSLAYIEVLSRLIQ
jgi:hypothetical protein